MATATLKARIYEPKRASDTDPGILFFHQGGLVIMHHLTDDYFCSLLADECRAKLITLDYRLCPEHAFPAAIEDGLALWNYVHDNAENLGIDRRRVALAGDSAGGLIASVMCQLLRDKAKLEKIAQPAAQLLAIRWVDRHNGRWLDGELRRHVSALESDNGNVQRQCVSRRQDDGPCLGQSAA